MRTAWVQGNPEEAQEVRETRDNGVMYAPTGFVNQAQLASTVAEAASKLGKDVVRIRHSIGTDSAGDPAIFFRIVLSDDASREATLADVLGVGPRGVRLKRERGDLAKVQHLLTATALAEDRQG